MMSMEKSPTERHDHSWRVQTKDLILLSPVTSELPRCPGTSMCLAKCRDPPVPSFWLSHCSKLVSCIRPVMGDSFKSLPGSCQANKACLWSNKDKQKVDLWHAVTLFTVERLGRLNAFCDVGNSVAMVTLLQRSIAENSIERCVWNIMSDDARDHLKTTLRFYEVKMDGLRRLKEVWRKPSRLDWFIIENNLFPHCKTVLFLIYWLVCYTHIWNMFNLLFELYNHSICTMHYVTVLSWSIGSFKDTLFRNTTKCI